jgi:hypothetical protein
MWEFLSVLAKHGMAAAAAVVQLLTVSEAAWIFRSEFEWPASAYGGSSAAAISE